MLIPESAAATTIHPGQKSRRNSVFPLGPTARAYNSSSAFFLSRFKNLDLQTPMKVVLDILAARMVRYRRTIAERKVRNRVAQRRPKREWLAAKHMRMKRNSETDVKACCSWKASCPVGPRRDAAFDALDKAMFGSTLDAARIAIVAEG